MQTHYIIKVKDGEMEEKINRTQKKTYLGVLVPELAPPKIPA